MQQGGDAPQLGARQFESMAEVALRGTALLWDLQMETARNLWRTQARTAAMLGVPDCSDLFDIGNPRARRLFGMGTEQMLNTARQARETIAEMQRQLGRIAEEQTIGITEDVRERIAEVSRHTEQGLQEIRGVAASQRDLAERAAHASYDEGPRRDRNAEYAPRAEPGTEGAPPMGTEPDEWEPRFDAGHSATNGAGESAEESGDAMEAGASQEERASRESRSRARR